MKRSALCVSVALLLCLVSVAGQARAQTQTFYVEDVVMTREYYPTVRASEGPIKVYAGAWQLEIVFRNPTGAKETLTCRIFLDNVLQRETSVNSFQSDYWGPIYMDPFYVYDEISFSAPGEHEVLIQLWREGETQPVTTYSFKVLAVAPKISNLQASSKVVRALGENTLIVSFTNGGNDDMRQAVLSVADPRGLTIVPNEVELGNVEVGESASANFTVSSPADVYLGTTQVRFSLSFIDYAGVPHTEDLYGEVEVYRLSSTLTVTAPGSVGEGTTAEIVVTLTGPDGRPIANEEITLRVGGAIIGSAKTDSNGVARASYTATEAGTLNIEASFPGSASYEASSASVVLEVTSPTDTTPPTVTLNAVPATTAESSITISGTVGKDAWESWSDITLTVQVGTTSAVVTVVDGRFSYSAPLAMGTNTIVVQAIDAAGNRSEARSATIERTSPPADTTPPTITVTKPASGTVTGEPSIVVAGKSTEPGTWTIVASSGIITGATDSEGNFTVPVPLVEGLNTIVVTAKDAAGNASMPVSIEVTRTAAPPAGTASPPDTMWMVILFVGLAVPVTLGIALAVWRKRRKQIVRPARGTRKEVQESIKIGMVGIARGITAQKKAEIAGGKVEQTELGVEHGRGDD